MAGVVVREGWRRTRVWPREEEMGGWPRALGLKDRRGEHTDSEWGGATWSGGKLKGR